MRNLCSAHWFHLLRHKAFWVSVLFMALYGGMEAVGLYRQGAEKLSDGLFAGLTFLGGGSGGLLQPLSGHRVPGWHTEE